MRDEVVTKFAVTTALLGVEERLATVRSGAEHERLLDRHRELRALLPAETSKPQPAGQPQPEQTKMTWPEFLNAKLRGLHRQIAMAHSDGERVELSREIIFTETCLASFGQPGKSPSGKIRGDLPRLSGTEE